MCGKFTQLSSWQEVHAFSQPLVMKGCADEVVVSTPMRFANIMRLNAAGVSAMGVVTWACLVVVGWLRWPWWTPLATFVVITTMDAVSYSARGGGFTDLQVADLAFRYALMLSAYLAACGRAVERAVRSRSESRC